MKYDAGPLAAGELSEGSDYVPGRFRVGRRRLKRELTKGAALFEESGGNPKTGPLHPPVGGVNLLAPSARLSEGFGHGVIGDVRAAAVRDERPPEPGGLLPVHGLEN